MQGERTDRRAPTSPRCTVARGNEPPMNPYERRGGPHKKNGPKYVAYVALYGARVAERTRRVAVTHSHRPTIYGPGVPLSPYRNPARVFVYRPARCSLTGAKASGKGIRCTP